MTKKKESSQYVTINMQDLKGMIKESVKKVLLNEKTDFSAKRLIRFLAQEASMDFEQNIIKTLDLVHPDEFNNPKLEERYTAIVEQMKQDIEVAVSKAVGQLVYFPRNQDRRANAKAPTNQ